MGKRSAHVRAERAAARETPDEITQIFDLESDRFRRDLHAWAWHFKKFMQIKHGPDVEIDLKHESIPGAPSAKLVTVFVRTGKGASEMVQA